MVNEKNILVATQNLGIGGCETYIYNYCEELIKRGYNIYIIGKDGKMKEKFEKIKAKVFNVDFFEYNTSFEKIEYIKKIIVQNKIKEVHIHPFYPFFEAVAASIMTQTPYSLFFHGVSLDGYFDINQNFSGLGKWSKLYIKNIALKYAKKYIYVSDEVKDFYENSWLETKDKGIILRNSIKLEEHNICNTKKIKKFILISRVDNDKFDSIKIGIQAYLKYYQLCEKYKDTMDLCLHIVGDGNRKEQLEEYIEEYGKYNVSYIGPTYDLNKIISNYDALMGMGRTILEAIANKKIPIIVSYSKYIGLLKIDEENEITELAYANFSGRNLEEKNVERDIERIYNLSQKEIEQIEENNYKYVDKNNNIKNNIEQLIKSFDESYCYENQVQEDLNDYLELIKYIKKIEKQNQKYENEILEKDNRLFEIKLILQTKMQEIEQKNEMTNNYAKELNDYKKQLNYIYETKWYKILKKIKLLKN